jgi:hypothetical protein
MCCHRPETLDISGSKQGAAPRQTISDGRFASVIFRGQAIDRTNQVMRCKRFS